MRESTHAKGEPLKTTQVTARNLRCGISRASTEQPKTVGELMQMMFADGHNVFFEIGSGKNQVTCKDALDDGCLYMQGVRMHSRSRGRSGRVSIPAQLPNGITGMLHIKCNPAGIQATAEF